MTAFISSFLQHLLTKRRMSFYKHKTVWVGVLILVLTTACSHFGTLPLPRDPAAEKMIETLKQTNIDLIRFKCVGKITVSGPKQPAKSYRSAIAGQLNDHLRIDLFAPFGGAAGSVASDGKHLFLVMHASGKYYKKRFQNGSLSRFVKMDVTVGDLLALLVGRIPIEDERIAQSMPLEDTDHSVVGLVDRRGNTRQKIILDTDGRPLRALWFDPHGKPMLALEISGQQIIDGFLIPTQVDLSAASGQTVSIRIERYQANPSLDKTLFVLPPISS
jgi:hypothetical protein